MILKNIITITNEVLFIYKYRKNNISKCCTFVKRLLSAITYPPNPVLGADGVCVVVAEIEEVGLDREGRMDVPKNVFNVGWYKNGPRPGEIGSAALDGHFDTPTGDPSVFYKLDKLTPGSMLTIFDKAGESFNFEVISGKNYALNEFPAETIFNKSDGKYLNLITCGGTWDKNSKNYSDRYVIFAQKVDNLR